jgi:sensory rhodopsin
MISSVSTLAALGAVGMALGTLPALWGLHNDPDRRAHYLVLSGVTGVAAVPTP